MIGNLGKNPTKGISTAAAVAMIMSNISDLDSKLAIRIGSILPNGVTIFADNH